MSVDEAALEVAVEDAELEAAGIVAPPDACEERSEPAEEQPLTIRTATIAASVRIPGLFHVSTHSKIATRSGRLLTSRCGTTGIDLARDPLERSRRHLHPGREPHRDGP